MTENKRFTYKHFDWLQWHIYDNGEYLAEASGNEEEDIKPLVDLLNSLNDENKQLKFELKECREHKLFSRRQLEEENEQLIKEIKSLREDLCFREMELEELEDINKNVVK